MPPEFAQQITESQQRLYGYIRSLIRNSAASRDILQETNNILWKKPAEFQPGSNFGQSHINAYQIRLVPEPSATLLSRLAALALLPRRRRPSMKNRSRSTASTPISSSYASADPSRVGVVI